MEKLQNTITVLLIGFFCAYTVNGIAQTDKPATKEAQTEFVIVKKTIKNGIEKVEKSVFKSDELNSEELEKMLQEGGDKVDVNIWKTDGAELPLTKVKIVNLQTIKPKFF